MVDWLRVNFKAAILIILMSIGFAAGWAVNGWRLSGHIEAGKSEATRLQVVIDRQDQATRQLAQESEAAAKAASAAQVEAGKLRMQMKAKASAIMALPASSCGEVLRNEWGRL